VALVVIIIFGASKTATCKSQL